MGLKLFLASWLTSERVLGQMLDRVAETTTKALDGLLAKEAAGAAGAGPGRSAAAAPPRGVDAPPGATTPPGPTPTPREAGNGLEARRAAMASGHEARVKALIAAIGRERAIAVGREALFAAGESLGREARERLGVVGGSGDLKTAATLLYRALGIHFELEELGDGTLVMRVDRCALADRYSADACEILSAADEGVMHGLDPSRRMRFEQRMTAGHPCCIARISKGAQ